MAFTYDTSTDLGKTRFAIGDVTSGSGVKPDGTNFTDAEVQLLLDREGSWGRAAAAACETLAVWYARAVNIAVGPRREDLSDIRKAYTEMGAALRKEHGGGASKGFSVGTIRVDGYQQSDEMVSNESVDRQGVTTVDDYGLIEDTSTVIYWKG